MDTKKEKDMLHTEKEITSKTSIGPTSFGPRMTGEAAAEGEGANRAAAARQEEKLDKKP